MICPYLCTSDGVSTRVGVNGKSGWSRALVFAIGGVGSIIPMSAFCAILAIILMILIIIIITTIMIIMIRMIIIIVIVKIMMIMISPLACQFAFRVALMISLAVGLPAICSQCTIQTG